MKLLYIITGFGVSDVIGGSVIRSTHIASHLESAGHDVRFVTTKGGVTALKRMGLGRHIYAAPASLGWRKESSLFPRSVSYLITAVSALWKTARLPECDIVYTDSDVLGDIAYAVLYKLKNRNARWVAIAHHRVTLPSRGLAVRLKRSVFRVAQTFSYRMIRRWADALFLLDSAEGREIRVEFLNGGYPIERIHMVANGVDVAGLGPLPWAQRSFAGCYLGGLRPGKGADELVPIWRRVITSHPRAVLQIIGAGVEAVRRQVVEEAKRSGLNDHVKLLGFIESRMETMELLRRSRVLAFPSREEGWGIPIAEAMALGVPVVAWDLPVYRDIFPKGMVRIAIGDHAAFADAIVRILDDNDYAQKLIDEGTEVAARYNWDEIANREAGLFQMVHTRSRI